MRTLIFAMQFGQKRCALHSSKYGSLIIGTVIVKNYYYVTAAKDARCSVENAIQTYTMSLRISINNKMVYFVH
jgi:hypothetical protein